MFARHTKENVASIVMFINCKRKEGAFFTSLLRRLNAFQEVQRASGNHRFKVPSRSTWYNYFDIIERFQPQQSTPGEIQRHAVAFCFNNQKNADLLFRTFCGTQYERIRGFLIDGNYLPELAESRSGSSSLFSAISDLLAPEVRSLDRHDELVGTYRIFRPAFTDPGKLNASVCRIEFDVKEGVVFKEVICAEAGKNIVSQKMTGTAVSQGGFVQIVMADSASRLIQTCNLKPVSFAQNDKGVEKISALAGIVSGASARTPSGFFSSKIWFERIYLERLARYDVHNWKISMLSGFGLIDRQEAPQRFRALLGE